MFDALEQALIAIFKWRERTALAIAEQLAALIEHIPEPARKYLPRPKSEHPSTYETIDPEIAHLQWMEHHQSSRD